MPDKVVDLQDLANRYQIPISFSKPSRRQTIPDTAPVSSSKLCKLVQKHWNEDFAYKSTFFKELGPTEHLNFTNDLLKSLNHRPPKPKISFPITVKTTESTRLKARTKFELTKRNTLPEVIHLPPKIKVPHPIVHFEKQLSPTAISSAGGSAGTAKSNIFSIREDSFEELTTEPEVTRMEPIFSKTILERTSEDHVQLFNYIRGFCTTETFSDVVLKEMVVIGSIIVTHRGHILAQSKTLLENMYIVLKGTVEIRKSVMDRSASTSAATGRTSSLRPSVWMQNSFSTGQKHTMGEVFVADRSNGSVLAVAYSDIAVLQLELQDYNRILKYAQDLERKKILVYLNTSPICQDLPADKKQSISLITKIKCFKKGAAVDVDNQPIDKIRILFKGKLGAHKMLPNGTRVNLIVINPGDYYGEQILLHKSNLSYFSVTALEDSEIGFVPAAEFNSLTLEKVDLQKCTMMSKDQYEIDWCQFKMEERREWKATKKAHIRGLIMEWLGDPSIDCANWSNKELLENYGNSKAKLQN